MPRLRKIILISSIILVIFLVHFWWCCLLAPDMKDNRGEIVCIESGLSTDEIVSLLKEKGLIKNKTYFLILAKIFSVDKQLKSGEYHLTKNMNTLKVLDHLKKGMVVTHRVVIPEGYNLQQIARTLEKKKIVSSASFLEVCNDKEFCSRFNLDEAAGLEGYLFPDTYFLAKNLSPQQIVTFMVNRFFEILPKNAESLAKEKSMTLHEIIIMASLIEKETSDVREMPVIASVFYNRLKKGMPLQCDPTVLYALGKVNKRLTRKDLTVDSPFNTYLYPKLPPGPIASPGLEAIKAALNSSELDYLYFVSQNNGSHYFSKSLSEHNKAVRKYQIKRKAGKLPEKKSIGKN